MKNNRRTLRNLLLLSCIGIPAALLVFPSADAAAICFWTSHTEVDFFETAAKNTTPVGWRVRTCSCNVYSEGDITPYYTVIAETPCGF